MSDTSRKVFPVESVLALVVGKEGVDVKEIAGFVAGRSVACDTCSQGRWPLCRRMAGPLVPQVCRPELG